MLLMLPLGLLLFPARLTTPRSSQGLQVRVRRVVGVDQVVGLVMGEHPVKVDGEGVGLQTEIETSPLLLTLAIRTILEGKNQSPQGLLAERTMEVVVWKDERQRSDRALALQMQQLAQPLVPTNNQKKKAIK
jgi:hypothetical protein